MKINKTVKIALGSILATVLLLFFILVVHIALAKPRLCDNATIQISRIDFKNPLDSLKMKEIHRNLKSIPGVQNVKINPEKGVVVYFHDNRITNSKKVFALLMTKGDYDAKPFILPKAMESKQVCPVMNHNSFSYKFSQTIQRIF